MKIVERIALLLEAGPKSVSEVRCTLNDVSSSSVRATISQRKDIFPRTATGLVSVVANWRSLISEKKFGTLKTHQKIVNLLVDGPLRISEVCTLMSGVSESTVRDNIRKHYELFVEFKKGWVDRVH